MVIHWHRLDLRGTDNRGLARAASEGTVVPVFVLDPAICAHGSPRRIAALLEALAGLREWYRERGGELVVERGPPAEVLPRLAEEHDTVVWCRTYSRLGRARDETVASSLREAGCEPIPVHDRLLHEPGSITTTAGDAYRVFTHFWRSWQERARPDPAPPPTDDALSAVTADPIPSLEDLGVDAPEETVQTVTPAAGHERLERFCDGPIYDYADERDRPDLDATSRLSVHLRWGTVGTRTVVAAVDAANDGASDEAAVESCEEFSRQLAWREFYVHLLAANPQLATENLRSFERTLEWAEDPAGVRAWKAGETGVPLVDAGMRQLQTEGFIHNRVRMIVASFLTKDLRVDWRVGYAWFREQLVDHDTANDAGGWQWVAGTGSAAQPYFRVLNPYRHAERFDPEGTYIRRHVEELADVPTAAIHDWPTLSPSTRDAHAPDYPAPIVDHQTRREDAIAMFEAALGD